MLPLALVSMPFMGADRPAIQLGLLASIAREAGFPARTLHANLEFAARVGAGDYARLAEHRGILVGDWLFSVEAFGDRAPDPEGRLPEDLAGRLRGVGPPGTDPGSWLRRLRGDVVPGWLDELAAAEFWDGVAVAGFSSSFQQNTASIALARRLKARHPGLVVLFGGANLDGEMGVELVRGAECVDVAIVGEADDALPALLAALAAGEDPAGVPGVVSRLGGGPPAGTPPAAPRTALDDLPVPDHSEFFDTAERLGLLGARSRTWVPVETSRGCWWGAKHHCVFCGLNGASMAYRAKSPERVLTELTALARATGSFRIAAVDNILDPRHTATLMPELAAAGHGFELFFEVKSNLGRDGVRTLARAGVGRIQPGIESLHTAVLGLMRKGVTAAQNVDLLRWARYYGVDVAWNILWGIPGETAAQQADQAALLPHLVHLQPPGHEGRVWLERFSPMFREPAERFRFREPERSYRYVYPADMDHARLAYFFDYELADALPAAAYDGLAGAAREWRRRWAAGDPPRLEYRWTPGLLQVLDTRRPERSGTHTYTGAAADVYAACADRPRTAAAVHRALPDSPGEAEVRRLIDRFAERGLLFLDGERALALALPATEGR